MAMEVILPRVDMDMTAGRIARWYVGDGATVEKGQPLFEIETDKAAMEIEAPGSGILRNVTAATGAAIPVGSTVAWICGPGEAAPPPAISPSAETASVARSEPLSVPLPPAPAAAAPAGVAATPLARRLARQHAIVLERITGSGPRRRIQARDVTAMLACRDAPSPPAPAAAARLAVTEGAALHRAWLRQGTGRPLVLVHGFGAELNGWRPLIGNLGLGRPILAVDLPGHGQSPAADAPSLEGFAAAVAAAMAAEGIAEADLAGHSLGAAVAACVAESAAFDLRSLLLIAPAGLGPDINGAFLDGFTRARSAASLAPWLRLLVSDAALLGEGLIRATARLRSDPAIVAAQAAAAAALFPDGTQAFSIRDRLARIAAPVRVVFGAEDRIIPARHARELPGPVALHLLGGVGHMPQLEAPAMLARILADHLHG